MIDEGYDVNEDADSDEEIDLEKEEYGNEFEEEEL